APLARRQVRREHPRVDAAAEFGKQLIADRKDAHDLRVGPGVHEAPDRVGVFRADDGVHALLASGHEKDQPYQQQHASPPLLFLNLGYGLGLHSVHKLGYSASLMPATGM